MLGGTAAGGAGGAGDGEGHRHEAPPPAADLHDRNRSISSAPHGAQHLGQSAVGQQQQALGQQAPAMQQQAAAGLSRFTAGFPPGPQQQLLAQLPWFAQLQNAAQMSGGGGGMGGDQMASVITAAGGGPRFRSSSFPANDAHGRLPSLSSQPSASSARPKVIRQNGP